MQFPQPHGHLVGGDAPPGHQRRPPRIVLGPLHPSPLAEVVLVVQSQFLEAGAGHIGEFEFGLFRGAAGLAALGDVLHAAARSLHHLVVSAAALVNVAVTKPHRHIVAQLRELKTLEFPVTSVLRDQGFWVHREKVAILLQIRALLQLKMHAAG